MESLPDVNERRAAVIRNKQKRGLVLSKFERRFLAFAEKKLTIRNNLWSDLTDLRLCMNYGLSYEQFRGVNPFKDEDPMVIYSQLMAQGDLTREDDEDDDYFKNYSKMCKALSLPEEEYIIDASPDYEDDLPPLVEHSTYAEIPEPILAEHENEVLIDDDNILEYTVVANEPYDLEEEVVSSVQVLPQDLCNAIWFLRGAVKVNDVVHITHTDVNTDISQNFIVHIKSDNSLRDLSQHKQVRYALKKIGRQTIFNVALNLLGTHKYGYFPRSAQDDVLEILYLKTLERLECTFPGWMSKDRDTYRVMARALSPRDDETHVIWKLLMHISEKESRKKVRLRTPNSGNWTSSP